MKVKLLFMHRDLVLNGQLEEAHRVLRLLRKRRVKLGLDDIDTNVELLLEAAHCPVHYSRNGYTAEFYF